MAYKTRSLSYKLWRYVTKHGRKVKYVRGRCWEWFGGTNNTGYGQIYAEGRFQLVHRISAELVNGPVPNGLCVCHSCDNKLCVRPSHLFIGTRKDNLQDMTNKNRRARGASMGMAKLDDGKVVRIRLLHKWGMTCADLSRKFGVTNGTMSAVLNRKTWRHVA